MELKPYSSRGFKNLIGVDQKSPPIINKSMYPGKIIYLRGLNTKPGCD
jgi:hypothetical protein